MIFSKISFYGQVSSTGPSIPAQVIHINVLVSPARPSLPNEQSQIQRWKSILMTQCRIPGKRTLKQCCQVRFYVVSPSCCKTRALLFLQEVVILPGTTGSIWAVPSCSTILLYHRRYCNYLRTSHVGNVGQHLIQLYTRHRTWDEPGPSLNKYISLTFNQPCKAMATFTKESKKGQKLPFSLFLIHYKRASNCLNLPMVV